MLNQNSLFFFSLVLSSGTEINKLKKKRRKTHVERVDDWDGRDGRADRSHAFVKLVLGLVCADDGPCGTIVDHLLVGFFRARRCLKTNKQQKYRWIRNDTF